MHNLNKILFSMVTYMLAGYLFGMTIGFTLFDPNLDMYALLGAVLGILGAVIGPIPFFRRYAPIPFGALIGFYIGALAGVLLFGSSASDDLLELLQRGGPGLVCAIVGTVLGGWAGVRLLHREINLPAMALLVGGFLGGYFFGFILRVAPSTKMVGIAPFIIGSALVCGLLTWGLQKRAMQST